MEVGLAHWGCSANEKKKALVMRQSSNTWEQRQLNKIRFTN
jgi:hypothetical protein